MQKVTVKDTKSFFRLAYFESRLFWTGRCGNIDIVKRFGISKPHASLMIREYEELAPGNIFYDPRGKAYRPTEKFKPVIISPDQDQAMGHILLQDGYLGDLPDMLRMPSPPRALPIDILRAMLSAIADREGIAIFYQSMSGPEPSWRSVTPHAFGSDGQRWHIRAYCHNGSIFKDFVLGRILETGGRIPAEGMSAEDTEWHESIDLILGPDPRLDPGPRAAIENDFCMQNGRVIFHVRRAMLWYALKYWNLDDEPYAEPRRQQVVLLNPEVLEKPNGNVEI